MNQLYPFTDPRAAEQQGPRVIVSGEGCWVTDEQGNRFLDAVSGLWCASLGFSHPELIQAATEQMQRLPYYHSFMGRTAGPTEALAEKLVSRLPAPLARVFFACSGSEAVDTAVKITRAYQNARGKPEKVRLIARQDAYHGSGFESAGLTGMTYCHDSFDLPGPHVIRAARPHHYRDAETSESEIDFAKRRARELEAQIVAAGPETVSAMIGEPVMGSGGVIFPPEGYWAEVQNVLAKHDVLLIADEIITGFGRTGDWFACETFGIRPDLMTMAKQLTSAYFPVSAVGVADHVYQTIADQAHDLGTFGHGFTYGGHPVGAAVALKTLEIYERMDLPVHVAERSRLLDRALEPVRAHPLVGSVRLMGLMAGVELKPGGVATGADVGAAAEAQGVFFRIIGDTLAISPPLIVSDEEIDQIGAVMLESLNRCLGDAS